MVFLLEEDGKQLVGLGQISKAKGLGLAFLQLITHKSLCFTFTQEPQPESNSHCPEPKVASVALGPWPCVVVTRVNQEHMGFCSAVHTPVFEK